MKLLQTNNEVLAMSLYNFLKRQYGNLKPFIFKQYIKFEDDEYRSYAVGYESIKKTNRKNVCLEKPFFTCKEIEEMVYRHKKFNY